jgi:hypothetical protein
MAGRADDEDSASRRKELARKAHDTAHHFLATATPTPQAEQEIREKIERLRFFLEEPDSRG